LQQNKGHIIQSTLRPATSADTFPVIYSNEQLGGHQSYDNLTELYSIPVSRRQTGMYAVVSGSTYMLSGGTSNTNWILLGNKILNTGNGIPIYSGVDVYGNFNLKTITGSSSNVVITQDPNTIYIDVTAQPVNLSNDPYGISWYGDSTTGATRGALYNEINSIGLASGNVAYVDSAGGSDSTAQVGNLIRPYQTIGNAIRAISGLTNATLYIRAGNYTMGDTDSPYGLKVPGSSYYIYIDYGANITYNGTYGLFISDNTTSGDILSNGTINCTSATFSGSINSVNNYAVNVATPYTTVNLTFYFIETTSNAITANCIRIGDCSTNNNSTTLTINNNCLTRGGSNLFFDAQSRCNVQKINFIQNTSPNAIIPIIISNPTQLIISNIIGTQFYGSYFSTQTYGIEITNENQNQISLIDLNLTTVDNTSSSYSMFYFNNTVSDYTNTLLQNVVIHNRQSTIYNKNGTSLYANNNISLKIINTYADTDVNTATGSITNVISNGVGFIYDPNL
jgi:hypothetical protein